MGNINLIIILVAKNISTTKQNAKIEVEGVNLKKKDGTFGTADWGNKQEIQEYLSIGKEMELFQEKLMNKK